MKRGLFCTLEGLDGSGSSSQALLLLKWFEQRGLPAHYFHSPNYESEIGFWIRSKLLRDGGAGYDELRRQQIFAIEKVSHAVTQLIPILDSGINVIHDRWQDSAYAFGQTEVDFNTLYNLLASVSGDLLPIPDLTLYMNVSPEVCAERMKRAGRGNEYYEKIETAKKVFGSYRFLITANRKLLRLGPCQPVGDDTMSVEAIHEQIVGHVEKLLKERE